MKTLTKRVKIYSNEHQAWWKPNYSGYTRDESKAGVFEIDDVYKNYGPNSFTFDTNKKDYFVEVIGLTESEQLAKYKHLEEEIGCPLEVRCKVVNNTSIFAEQEWGLNSNEWLVDQITSVGFHCRQEYISRIHFWKDYKKTWWLREDKSE